MSYNPKAYALIGLRIHAYQLYKEKCERGCNHHIETRAKFCSECGKKAWIKDNIPIEGYDEAEQTLCHIHIIKKDDFAYLSIARAVDGIYDDGSNSLVALNVNDIKATRDFIKSKLEPLNLWNEAYFGLWAVLN